jgi:hypothetical protein
MYLREGYPSISRAEVRAVRAAGIQVQEDHEMGAQSGGPVAVFLLHDEARRKAEEIAK